jgi:hypothetical protein
MSGGACSLEETIARVKALDERREYLSNSSASTVRKHCIINGITHSSHYDKERESRNWPSKPWDIMQLTPYAFFHPNASCIELSFLKDTLIQKNIRTLQAYREQIKEPSVEDINDGYFRGITNLNDVLPSGSRRR